MSKVKVLHFSSRYEDCGVAKYLGHYVSGMKDSDNVENEYFDVSPYETYNMKPADLDKMVSNLAVKLADYDILHIQHEFALYAHDSFRRIVEAGKKANKKIVITVHTSPEIANQDIHLGGLGPRSILHFLRQKRRREIFISTHIVPLRSADVILAHNDLTIRSLIDHGVQESKIIKTIHPVQQFDNPPESTIISDALNKKPGDIIYCTIGFLHRYKGIDDAIKALKLLPENYKLAIIGGMKEDSDDVALYNKLSDLIVKLELQNRVYITGYVKDDNQLNAMIRECDMCVYAFDRKYYAYVSSGSMNLAFANGLPAIAYPTAAIKEISSISDGAIVLCETFAYYELARRIKNIDITKQSEKSKSYANKMSWSKSSKELEAIYSQIVSTDK